VEVAGRGHNKVECFKALLPQRHGNHADVTPGCCFLFPLTEKKLWTSTNELRDKPLSWHIGLSVPYDPEHYLHAIMTNRTMWLGDLVTPEPRAVVVTMRHRSVYVYNYVVGVSRSWCIILYMYTLKKNRMWKFRKFHGKCCLSIQKLSLEFDMQ